MKGSHSTHGWRRALIGALVLVALIAALAAGVTPAQAETESTRCATFDELAMGTRYVVGDKFLSTLPFEVRPLLLGDGTPIRDGSIEVGDALRAGGAGKELVVANARVRLILPPTAGITALTARFGEYGGVVNLLVNGDLRTVDNLAELNGQTVGGALVTVVNGAGDDAGEVQITGLIMGFELGGQEFFLDDLCVEKENGQPGTLVITKTVEAAATPLQPGDVMTYTVRIEHVGGSTLAPVSMVDRLPMGVQLAGRIDVVEETPEAAPLLAFYSSRTVKWLGALSPGGKVAVTFPVRFERCATAEMQEIVNTASLVQVGGGPAEASVTVPVNCPPPPEIEVTKSIIEFASGNEIAMEEADVVPGQNVRFRFTLVNASQFPAIVPLRDQLPDGLVVLDEGGVGGIFDKVFRLGAGETRHFDLRARLVTDLRADSQLVNVAHYVACTFTIQGGAICPWPEEGNAAIRQTNAVTLTVRGLDLGDAPDSSNHFGAAMNAYGGVAADFATVIDRAGGVQGPAHANPLPFHLGAGVSREVNADIGPDADPVNNILPPLNVANRDHFDDGVAVGALRFEHCKPAEIPVQVFISPDVIGVLEQGIGYLNVWIDGERNGDWRDVVECPAVNEQPAGMAFEHIVIDHPIDVAALGPGLHSLTVATTHPVLWPTEKATLPAWLRVTLSEQPANKTLNAGAVTFGDGRGYDSAPFRWGETEDYLWRAQADPAAGADLYIRKQGVATPAYAMHGEPGEPSAPGFDQINWVIEYANRGLEPAANVEIVDDLTLAGDLSALEIRTAPAISYTQEGATLRFAVGSLAPGAHGRIVLKTGVPAEVATTLFTNTATINAEQDANLANNEAVAQVTLTLRTPVIFEPGSGTTCDNEVTMRGRALPNAEVDLYLDSALLATVTADKTGYWNHVATVADGDHELFVVARRDGLTSAPSRTSFFTVDPSLVWSPLSLRFTDEHGRSYRPVDASGRTDESGWTVHLRPNRTYTVTVQLCCTVAEASAQLRIGEETVIDLFDPDGDGVYAGTFTVGEEITSTATFAILAQCGATSAEGSGMALIDPEGVVHDVRSGAPLAAATVACLEGQPASNGSPDALFTLWPAADYGQINPQVTAADGYFSFFTPVGVYRLEAALSGYQPYRSTDIQVIDEAVRYDIPLTPQHAITARHTIQVTEYGFEPAYLEVAPGDVVEWVNMAAEGHSAVSLKMATGAAVGEAFFDSGLLLSGERYSFSFEETGEFSYSDATNPANSAVIVVRSSPVWNNTIFLPAVSR